MTTAGYLERDVQAGDIKLHYQEWGSESAPVILMLHGFGLSGHMFDEFAERAQHRYRLIALDQRGHGDSEWAKDGDYSREAFVRDLEHVREALGLDRFVLMGHSMGGLNAVAYTAKHPDHVRALILVDVGPEAAREGVDNIRRFVQGPDELEFEEFVQLAHRFNPRRSLENIRQRMRHRLRQTESGKWTWKFDKRFRDPNAQLRVGSDLSNDQMWQLFRSIHVPTLLVRGAESDVLTQEVAERTVREMPKARLAVVPGAGHSVPGDNPDAFTEAVLSFLDDVESGRFQGEAQPQAALAEQANATPVEGRRRYRVLAAVLAGVAVVALGGGAALIAARRLRRRRSRRERLLAQARRPLEAVQQLDGERIARRIEELADELADVGRRAARQAQRRLHDVDAERARQLAAELIRLVEEQSREVPRRARGLAERADGTRLRRSGSGALRLVGRAGGAAGRLAVRSLVRGGAGAVRRAAAWQR